MPATTLPNLGLDAFFTAGEDGWGDDMDLNLLKLSVLAQARVLTKTNATPGSPAAGDVVLFGASHPTQANKIAVYINAAWTYLSPLSGWSVYVVDADEVQVFDGTVWAVSSSGGGLTDAPSDGTGYVRKDGAWEPESGASVTQTYAYWRLMVLSNNGSLNLAIGEVEMRATVSGADQCSGGTATSSGNLSGSYLPGNAFANDGGTTFWVSDHENGWIAYQFAAPVAVAEVAVTSRGDGYPDDSLRFMQVQASADGVTWKPVGAIHHAQGWSAAETRVFRLPAVT